MQLKRIYMAGPVQHVDDYGVGWRQRLKREYDCFEWADPLDAYHAGEATIDEEWTDVKIIQKDLEMIDECDGLIVGWGDVPSAGTPMEVFYASFVRRIPVAIKYDGDEISPWMSGHATAVEPTFDAAVNALLDIFAGNYEGFEHGELPYEYNAARDIERIIGIVEEREFVDAKEEAAED